MQATRSGACLTPADEKLGFEAAVAALGKQVLFRYECAKDLV